MATPFQCFLGPHCPWWSTVNIKSPLLSKGSSPSGHTKALGCSTYTEGPSLGQGHWGGERYCSRDKGWGWELSGRNLVDMHRKCFSRCEELPLNLCLKLKFIFHFYNLRTQGKKNTGDMGHRRDVTGKSLWRSLWILWLVFLIWRGEGRGQDWFKVWGQGRGQVSGGILSTPLLGVGANTLPTGSDLGKTGNLVLSFTLHWLTVFFLLSDF